MEIVNLTPFATHVMPSMSRDDHDLALLVVMASFELPAPGQRGGVRRAAQQPPPPMADAYHGDPTCSSLRVEGQSAYTRPGTDIYVHGHAWAPRGRPATETEVLVRVGPCLRTAAVIGDRVWVRSFASLIATRPAPFDRIPLVWERSFGGSPARARGRRAAIAARNPVGRGLYAEGALGACMLRSPRTNSDST